MIRYQFCTVCQCWQCYRGGDGDDSVGVVLTGYKDSVAGHLLLIVTCLCSLISGHGGGGGGDVFLPSVLLK